MSHNATSGRDETVPSVMFFVLPVEGKELKQEMSIACWSELLNCDSAFSKHARAYSAHPLNPPPSNVERFSTAVQFSIKFPLFFHYPPALSFTLKLLVKKSLCYEGWPKHLQLEFQRSCSYNLRSSDAPRLSVPRETDTFKSIAARSFNSLPDSVRHLTDYHKFAKATRKYLFQKLKTQVV